MIRLIRNIVFGKPPEEKWQAICAIALQEERWDGLRNNKTLLRHFISRLNDGLTAIGEKNSKELMLNEARELLMSACRVNAEFRVFLQLSCDSQEQMSKEYWPNKNLSLEESKQAAKHHVYLSEADIWCYQLVLNDLVKPEQESWWEDYLYLSMAGKDTEIKEAEYAISKGNGLSSFANAISLAKVSLKVEI